MTNTVFMTLDFTTVFGGKYAHLAGSLDVLRTLGKG